MVVESHSLAALVAAGALGAAFVAAWFEEAKRTPAVLISLFALSFVMLSMSRTVIGHTAPWLAYPNWLGLDASPSTGEMIGLALTSVGVLLLSRRGATAASSTRSLQRALASTSRELLHAQSVAESMLRSSLGAKIMLKSCSEDRDSGFKIMMVNGEIEQLFGAPSSMLIGKKLDKVCPVHLRQWLIDLAYDAIETKLPCQDERRFDGKHTVWYEVRSVSHRSGVTMTIADVTDRRRVEDALRREAHTDPLTGLANRAKLKEALAGVVHRAYCKSGPGLTLLYLDFDRFKFINDSLGHDVGDELLCSIASRLQEAVRSVRPPHGELIAARLGGDEFVLLLEGMTDTKVAREFAERIVQRFAEPHQLGEHTVISTVSVGVVTDRGNYVRAENLLRDADLAMYAAKESGKNRFVIFDEGLRERALSTVSLEHDLRTAIETGEFTAAFQPIIDLHTGQIHSFEALIRWQHEGRGYVPPEVFIPLAEELGLIDTIGQTMLREACLAVRRFKEILPRGRKIAVSVNHSKRELLSGRFVETMADVLQEMAVEAELIRVEVTESVCVAHQASVVPVLNGLRSLGVQIVIDDFGTGDSSFFCIEQFPVDQLKIDQRFLRSDRDEPTRRTILNTMLEMGQSLDVPVVCEGIETVEDLDLLVGLGCQLGQGWVFAEAMDLEEAMELCASGLERWIENLPVLESIRSKTDGREAA
ncbi:MAG TPA: EAL domain-containing protein [Phycisphaerales bacterium]|nr:EAL domain-containing protein [Phycisphaerales bacterium]